MNMKDILVNNLYYYTGELIKLYGASYTLLLIGLFLIVTTLMKTSCYFASAGMLVPMRTGIVRDKSYRCRFRFSPTSARATS